MLAHRVEQRGERTIDVLTNEESGLRIAVSRLGAELVSLARRDSTGKWVGFLYRDDDLAAPATGWANHATVMGYYLHRLKNGTSRYRGQEIKGGTHSFLRSKTWHFLPESADAGELSYRITPADFSQTDYPLQVSLDLTYRIAGEKLSAIFHFRNAETRLPAHVSFGLHPGFGAARFDSFKFEMPAGHYRRYFSPGNFLSGETEEIDFAGGEMPFPRGELSGSYIIELVDVPAREFRFIDQPSGRTVVVDLTGVPFLTLWADGGPFLCIEPCWGLTDHQEQRNFEDKAGIQIIPPSGELMATCAFAARLLNGPA